MKLGTELFKTDTQPCRLATQFDGAMNSWLSNVFKEMLAVFGRNQITPELRAYRSSGIQYLRCDLVGIDEWENDSRCRRWRKQVHRYMEENKWPRTRYGGDRAARRFLRYLSSEILDANGV